MTDKIKAVGDALTRLLAEKPIVTSLELKAALPVFGHDQSVVDAAATDLSHKEIVTIEHGDTGPAYSRGAAFASYSPAPVFHVNSYGDGASFGGVVHASHHYERLTDEQLLTIVRQLVEKPEARNKARQVFDGAKSVATDVAAKTLAEIFRALFPG